MANTLSFQQCAAILNDIVKQAQGGNPIAPVNYDIIENCSTLLKRKCISHYLSPHYYSDPTARGYPIGESVEKPSSLA